MALLQQEVLSAVAALPWIQTEEGKNPLLQEGMPFHTMQPLMAALGAYFPLSGF
jgi:hypothetical protein